MFSSTILINIAGKYEQTGNNMQHLTYAKLKLKKTYLCDKIGWCMVWNILWPV